MSYTIVTTPPKTGETPMSDEQLVECLVQAHQRLLNGTRAHTFARTVNTVSQTGCPQSAREWFDMLQYLRPTT